MNTSHLCSQHVLKCGYADWSQLDLVLCLLSSFVANELRYFAFIMLVKEVGFCNLVISHVTPRYFNKERSIPSMPLPPRGYQTCSPISCPGICGPTWVCSPAPVAAFWGQCLQCESPLPLEVSFLGEINNAASMNCFKKLLTAVIINWKCIRILTERSVRSVLIKHLWKLQIHFITPQKQWGQNVSERLLIYTFNRYGAALAFM